MKKAVLLIYTILFSINYSLATIGGPREVKAIGYTEEKVFFTNEYFDESGRGAQLWIYDIQSGTLSTDDSWSFEETYRETYEVVKDMRTKYAIKKMKKEFDEYSFNINELAIGELETIQKFDSYIEAYYNVYPFIIQYGKNKIILETCDGGEPKIQHSFTINKNNFVIVRYTGLCYETGYKKDTLLAFHDSIINNLDIEDTVIFDEPKVAIDSIVKDSTATNGKENQQETYWKRGNPNYLFIIFPIGIILLAIIVLKWKRKED